jgi:hypothetical protein
MKLYRIVNTATYPKRLILDNHFQILKGKNSIDLECSEEEANRLHRSPELLISEVAKPKNYADCRRSARTMELQNPDFYTGRSATVSPPTEPRPLYEELFIDLFGLKNRMNALEAGMAIIRANLSQDRGSDNLLGLMTAVADIQARIVDLEKHEHWDGGSTRENSSLARSAASELLNVDPNPKEARRALFQKVVDSNKKLRE